MRKDLTDKLLRLYLGTFPPVTPNGNNWFGNLKRATIARVIGLINGGKGLQMVEQILDEWTQQGA